MTTLVDTDVLLALVHPKDLLHERAVALAKQLAIQQTTLFLLPTTLGEFATLASLRMSFDQSKRMVEVILSQNYVFIDVTGDMVREANLYYGNQRAKGNSLFDCLVMVAARMQGIDCIFSFDKGYTQNVLILAEAYSRIH